MVGSHFGYGVSQEHLFDSIKNIASNQLFECDIIVPNVCNIDTKQGSPFMQESQRVFPKLLGLDVHGRQKLGFNQYIEVARYKKNRIFFCNMYAEKHRKNKRNLNYLYLFNCMIHLRNLCYESKKNTDRLIKIHSRKDAFGINNNRGGKWSTISDILADCWNGIEVVIHV